MSRRAKRRLHGEDKSLAKSNSMASPGGHSFPAKTQAPHRWLPFAICLFLGLAVWVVFGQTLHHKFVNYDDDFYVYENWVVAQGISLKGIDWAFNHVVLYNWHPLTMITHMLDCQIYGLQAGGHHLTSVLLHTASAMLLFLLLRNLTGALWRSAFVAAVFAIHPLRVESVAWVAERKDVLSGLFFMLTLWSYERYASRPFTALMVVSSLQVVYWRDSESLWTHTLDCTPENSTAHVNLGVALAGQGKLAVAIQHYERALQLNPDSVAAHGSLGLALARQGKLAEAVQHYERTLQLDPDNVPAHNNLGIALVRQGRLAEAIQHFNRTLQLNPNHLGARNNLALALSMQEKPTVGGGQGFQ